MKHNNYAIKFPLEYAYAINNDLECMLVPTDVNGSDDYNVYSKALLGENSIWAEEVKANFIPIPVTISKEERDFRIKLFKGKSFKYIYTESDNSTTRECKVVGEGITYFTFLYNEDEEYVLSEDIIKSGEYINVTVEDSVYPLKLSRDYAKGDSRIYVCKNSTSLEQENTISMINGTIRKIQKWKPKKGDIVWHKNSILIVDAIFESVDEVYITHSGSSSDCMKVSLKEVEPFIGVLPTNH